MCPYSARPTQVIAPRLGELLTKAMADADIRIRPLAELSGVDKNTIVAWRRPGGGKAVNVAAVERVAAVLGTTAEHLLDLPSSQKAEGARSAPAEWREILDRVEDFVQEVSTLIDATHLRGTDRRP